MSARIGLARIEDVVEGQPLAVQPEGFGPLAVYRAGDEFFVTSNVCTHGLAMLTDGDQDGAVIECAFHGGTFDLRTGAALSFPCTVALKTFPVTLEDGQVCIDAPEVAK
ncbi:non-heme iron oxygenase ferredoxin subunit [Panacagrimonas sp.]|uniref:non-heme iron oxygenase ferredoxin subunit n=1 Tax=Panacagrimonas sp. TaxID=2480088 RepID=UPI003B529EAA